MGVDVVTRIEIARAREEVAHFAADVGNATAWYANIRSVEWRTEPPLAVGSRVAFVAMFLGRRLAYTYEIRELVPGERLVMSTQQGPFPMETTYTWADAGPERTLMTLRNRGEPAGFKRVGAPVMARQAWYSDDRSACLQPLSPASTRAFSPPTRARAWPGSMDAQNAARLVSAAS